MDTVCLKQIEKPLLDVTIRKGFLCVLRLGGAPVAGVQSVPENMQRIPDAWKFLYRFVKIEIDGSSN